MRACFEAERSDDLGSFQGVSQHDSTVLFSQDAIMIVCNYPSRS